MRLVDADELMEHVWRDKLDSRELIAKMIDNAPTVKEIPTKIPINVFEQLISQEPVLNKIREQIMSNLKGVDIALEVLGENHPLRQKMEGAKDTLVDCLELIDKAESGE